MARSLPPIPTCRFRQFLNMAYHGSQYASITQFPFFPFVHQHAYIINLRGENYISSKKTRLETQQAVVTQHMIVTGPRGKPNDWMD